MLHYCDEENACRNKASELLRDISIMNDFGGRHEQTSARQNHLQGLLAGDQALLRSDLDQDDISPPPVLHENNPGTEESNTGVDEQQHETSPPPVVNLALDAEPFTTQGAVSSLPLLEEATHNEYLQTFRAVIEQMKERIDSSQSPAEIKHLSDAQNLQSAIAEEIELEKFVEQRIEILKGIVSSVENDLYKSGQGRYQAATGLFDGKSTAIDVASALSALTTFSIAAGACLQYHHAATHLLHTAVKFVLGDSVLSFYLVSVPASVLTLGVISFAGSLVGPMSLALLKTLGGRTVQKISPASRNAFQDLARKAQGDAESFKHLTSAMAQELANFQPVLSEFYRRNNDVRSEKSARLHQLPHDGCAVTTTQFSDLYRLSRALGAAEFITLTSCRTLEKSLRELSEADFRSPELIQALRTGSVQAPPLWDLPRLLVQTKNSLVGLWRSAQSIGKRSALLATQKSRAKFEDLPRSMLGDVVAGVGSGISTTIEQALRAADQPGKTTYSFVKAAIGMVKDKLVGGEREGPRPETLIRVIFQLSELKDDSWVRSFTRVFFCLLRLAIQKPVIFEQADLEEELSGRVSPKLIQSKLAEKRGTLTMTKNMALDLTKLAFETVKDSVVRYALVAPIELLRGSSIVKRFAPPLALLAEQSLNRYHQSTRAALYRKQEYYLAKLPNEKLLRELQESELDVHVIERYIDYLYRPQMRVSDAEISNLLNYWEIRRKISWLESADNVAKHKQELKSLHPKFRKLPDLLHPQSGLFATLINDLRASRTQDEQSELTDAEVILANFASWAHSLQGQVSPPQPVFLESSADRLHAVLLDTDGSLRLVGAGEVKRLFVHTSPEQQPQVLEHAEEARVTLIEMALGMALEPFQRRTVIETCRERRKNSITKEQALKRLTSTGIPAGPLLGAPGCHGLLDSRLLGA